ncbi:YceD family protein [Streptococcus caprae]|uniref:YceD family protein n=1 Tax=Streptococcus caprae TaxID=1640501 RepID=A0ABV8CVT9_9STRE
MFSTAEIKKKTEGIVFDEILNVKDELCQRDSEIIDIKDVRASGKVTYEQGLYLLQYNLAYKITLPSSRSMEPVELVLSDDIMEPFIESEHVQTNQELIDTDLILVLEGQTINLRESVIDNILLNIPLRVLSPDEEADDQLPSGKDWSVLTQEQYQTLQEEKHKETNPFSVLDGLFDN